jgi:hypothetical protein
MNREKLLKNIKEDWEHTPVYPICLKILDYIDSQQARQVVLRRITFGSLKRIVDSKYPDRDILLAAQYLCGSRTPLLEPKFELVLDDQSFDLSHEEALQVHETGELFHEISGKLIPNAKSIVFMYFCPRQLII